VSDVPLFPVNMTVVVEPFVRIWTKLPTLKPLAESTVPVVVVGAGGDVNAVAWLVPGNTWPRAMVGAGFGYTLRDTTRLPGAKPGNGVSANVAVQRERSVAMRPATIKPASVAYRTTYLKVGVIR
jgi:hypothetical protein